MMFYFLFFFFFFKQKTAYEMRISDWSSDVCSSDLKAGRLRRIADIIARKGEQDRIDALHEQIADGRPLHRRKVEAAGERRQRPASIRVGCRAKIISDQLQLAVATARIDQRINEGGEALHPQSMFSKSGHRFRDRKRTRLNYSH